MLLEDFKLRLRTALGKSLENATPENVREFVDQVQQELWREEHPKAAPGSQPDRIDIPSTGPLTYESMIQSFFVQALESDRDQSLIQLWIIALDLAYSGIEEMHSESMRRLFESEQID